jgi:hypothetical protein
LIILIDFVNQFTINSLEMTELWARVRHEMGDALRKDSAAE